MYDPNDPMLDDDIPSVGFAPIPMGWEVEDLDQYCPGGLHPIIIGDTLGDESDDQRFEVVHKLGHGGFATVWLCYDHTEGTWKAVKVIAADASDEIESSELFILEHFEDVTDDELEENHISLPRDYFWITGPNGRHLCIVMPVFGQSLHKIWMQHGQEHELLRKVCRDLARAMEFIHSKGICHGDFRPHNILFKLRGIDQLDYEDIIEMAPDLGQMQLQHDPSSGEPFDPHTPQYIYPSTPLEPPAHMLSGDIVVTDFGEAYHADEGRITTGIPLSYAAPEVILKGHELGRDADIWALGATILEIRQGETPCSESSVSEYVRCLEQLLGPLPEPYRSVWIEKGYKGRTELPALELPLSAHVSMLPEYFTQLREDWLKNHGYDNYLEIAIRNESSFGTRMKKGEVLRPNERDNGDGWKWVTYQTPLEEASELIDLLTKIFKYSPGDRLTATEVLAHPWLNHNMSEKVEETHDTADDTMEDIRDELDQTQPAEHHEQDHAQQHGNSAYAWIAWVIRYLLQYTHY
jgi:serine/threonine protein kinase